jgi:transcriptional regulator with XRE-family HTH domain
MVAVTRITEYPPCETLKRVRIEKGLTQSDLSVLLIQAGYRVSSQYISGFESGHRHPWPKARKAIACVLGIEEKVLFSEIN